MKLPRLFGWWVFALTFNALIFFLAPQQIAVSIYKLNLVAIAAVVAYCLDRSLFPYARPDSYLEKDWREGTCEPWGDADYRVVSQYVLPFCAAMIRRALIVAAAMVAVGLGA